METDDVHALVDDLSANLDTLTTALEPLTNGPLTSSTSKLPLLDKAKLYVLATYALESLLFSAVNLAGSDAKTHPVFQELGRVREYFAKIKTAEGAGKKRGAVVDREAAGRFIRHGLAGNEKYDRERGMSGKRKVGEISVGTHTRFDGFAKRIRVVEAEEVSSSSRAQTDESDAGTPGSNAGRRSGSGRAAVDAAAGAEESRGVSSAPQSDGEAFDALARGTLFQDAGADGEGKERKRGKKKKRKSREEKIADEMR